MEYTSLIYGNLLCKNNFLSRNQCTLFVHTITKLVHKTNNSPHNIL